MFTVLILIGDFKHLHISWQKRHSKSLAVQETIGVVEDKFLIHVMKSLTREALLDLLLTNVEEFIGEIMTGGSLGCRDHALVECSILRGTGR